MIPEDRMRWTARWMWELAEYWNEELPLKVHRRDLDDGGTPDWHQDFALWLLRPDLDDRRWRERPEPRVRTTRAMRKLREKFPREYEVLYRTAILGLPIRETISWLNQRAIRHGKPERYNRESVLLYLLVAAEKTHAWMWEPSLGSRW